MELMWQGKFRFSTALYFIIRYLPVASPISNIALSTTTPQVFFGFHVQSTRAYILVVGFHCTEISTWD
jgi:hypothetical protein